MNQRIACSPAREAGFGPGLAAAAAVRARRTQGHIERYDDATRRFASRYRHLRRQGVGLSLRAEKALAHAGHELTDAREIDGDFVGEAVAWRRSGAQCVPFSVRRKESEVFAAHDSHRYDRSDVAACQGMGRDLRSSRIMPGHEGLAATAEHNSSAYSLYRTFRSPEASTNITTEWICPDCDYFEDVEEESESGAPRLARANRQ
jgi:hypothetical protein